MELRQISPQEILLLLLLLLLVDILFHACRLFFWKIEPQRVAIKSLYKYFAMKNFSLITVPLSQHMMLYDFLKFSKIKVIDYPLPLASFLVTSSHAIESLPVFIMQCLHIAKTVFSNGCYFLYPEASRESMRVNAEFNARI
jgi:hypothetical protein